MGFVAVVWSVVVLVSLVVLANPKMDGWQKAGSIVGIVALGWFFVRSFLYGD
jgi:hypothetical protein